MVSFPLELRSKVGGHLERIYGAAPDNMINEVLQRMNYERIESDHPPGKNYWDESRAILITYGDSITGPPESPLASLNEFVEQRLSDVISDVHILPFFPSSSDDGFAVKDYLSVDEELGQWSDIELICKNRGLLVDLVINHCSSEHPWFEQFKSNAFPGKDFFVEVDPLSDLSKVVRPRTSELLRETEREDGSTFVWCTFSHDQVDLDFANPEVLKEMVSIIRFLLGKGVRGFRLDAVAFLWKESNTTCLNLPQTHEIVRLLRTLIEHYDPSVLIITETNIPNRENLSYFGNGNEAHIIYNFALPPLILQAMVTGNNYYLNNWLMSMPPAQDGTTYLNFIASHDGIGLRPVEGILSQQEIQELIETMRDFGGLISSRNLNGGSEKPYEINISLFSALQGTVAGPDEFQVERFLCAHTIMMALEGIPAFYLHSFLGAENDMQLLGKTGRNRSINRGRFDLRELERNLDDIDSSMHRVFYGLQEVLSVRQRQTAFHPNATQYTLHLGEGLFSFWRQSRSRSQSIFCVHNISDREKEFSLDQLNLIETDEWFDLLSARSFPNLKAKLSLRPYQCLWLTNGRSLGNGSNL